MGTNRTNKSYVDGVAVFIDYVVHNLQKMGNINLRVNKRHLLMPYFASDIPTDGPATVEMVNATKDNFDEDDLVKFQELLLDAEKPLYEGCPDFTKLSAIVKLLNLKGKYGASDKFFTELLGLIKKMLPADSQAWRTIDEKFPKIAKDPRNLRLGISADGVDVNTGNRHHSV
ncbi:ribonuclease H-like domain-containing protein [Tanacetum coccineum]